MKKNYLAILPLLLVSLTISNCSSFSTSLYRSSKEPDTSSSRTGAAVADFPDHQPESAKNTAVVEKDTASSTDNTKMDSTVAIAISTKTRRIDVSPYRSREMEEKVRHVPSDITVRIFKDPDTVLSNLVDFLASGEDDPFMQAKLIHDWIADNIAYDTDSYFSGKIPAQEWRSTLRSRKSVCEGYAGLFKRMCDLAGIRCIKISGYSRGYGFSLFKREDFSNSNHSWNAVNIDNIWYLIDCTWDAGHVNGRTYNKEYSTQYLFLEPEYMIYTHFPMDPKLQFIDPPLTAKEVEGAPKYDGEYFLYGLKRIQGINKLNQAGSTASFSFHAPEDVVFTTWLSDEKRTKYENCTLLQKDRRTSSVHIAFPKAGYWKFRLFAKHIGEDGGYESIAEIGFVTDAGTERRFPLLYSTFMENSCFIHSPVHSPLRAGETVDFKLKLPGYKQAYALAAHKRYPLEAGPDDVFEGSVPVPKTDKLTIFAAKETGHVASEGICMYKIRE